MLRSRSAYTSYDSPIALASPHRHPLSPRCLSIICTICPRWNSCISLPVHQSTILDSTSPVLSSTSRSDASFEHPGFDRSIHDRVTANNYPIFVQSVHYGGISSGYVKQALACLGSTVREHLLPPVLPPDLLLVTLQSTGKPTHRFSSGHTTAQSCCRPSCLWVSDLDNRSLCTILSQR